MNPTQQVRKRREIYLKEKAIQNLANPNRGSDPTERFDIKNILNFNLGDVIPQFFVIGCCYPVSGSIGIPPAGIPLIFVGIPPLATPEITLSFSI